MKHITEIYLTTKYINQDEWQQLINTISKYNGYFKKWKIIISFKDKKIRYFCKTNCKLPVSINGLKSFVLKESNLNYKENYIIPKPYFISSDNNIADIYNYINIKKDSKLILLEIAFNKLTKNLIKNRVSIITKKKSCFKRYIIPFAIPKTILSVNFETNYNLLYKGAPKYLDISKSLHLLKTEPTDSILEVDTFPYLQGKYYLEQQSINFDRHSIIFGASGCGKSKFISLMINNIYKNNLYKDRYKIVVIDPHASLENDIGGLGRVIDFNNNCDTVNLFSNSSRDVVVSVELLLDVFKGLIPNSYNSKLERVLRHSLYLLLYSKSFNFTNLRKLLLELDYRNDKVKQYEQSLPMSIIEFFLSEFNDIKTKSYTEAISPIIALIDEMEMIPVFNKDIKSDNLEKTIKDNFLTIISLDRTKLGDKVTKTISGLVMQQLLTLVQNYTFNEHIIFIVDEVAVVENPILNRFLAEARKYRLSLILAGQYFGGVSESLRKAIFANVINYYMFRVSKDDATILVDNFNMKVPLNDSKEQKIKIITELQDRECLIRVNSNNILLPAIKCKTLFFKSIPRIKTKNNEDIKGIKRESKFTKFNSNTNIKLKDILISNSTSRKVVGKDE